MNEPIITSTKINKIVKNSNEKQLIKIFKKNPTISRFYQQKSGFRPLIQSKTTMKKQRNNATLQWSLDRMVCSEEVSRKKYVKIDDTPKFMKLTSYTSENIENNGDFLDKLKDRCRIEQSNFSSLISRNQQHRKLVLKPKTLLNDESLKLMNNFKEYMKKKEEIPRKNINIELSMENNVSIPLSDNNNCQYSQGIVPQDNIIMQNNKPINNSTLSNLQNPFEPKTITKIPVQLNSQIETVNTSKMTSQSFGIRPELIGIKSKSPSPLTNPRGFEIDSAHHTNDGIQIIHYSTPPLIQDATNILYN